MELKEGHGVLGKIRFLDGTMPEYNRTYLVVTVATEYIELLNVSSIKGKERKLAFSSNERLRRYNPPFLKPSFVKLDSLIRVVKEDADDLIVLNKGRTLEAGELSRIKNML